MIVVHNPASQSGASSTGEGTHQTGWVHANRSVNTRLSTHAMPAAIKIDAAVILAIRRHNAPLPS